MRFVSAQQIVLPDKGDPRISIESKAVTVTAINPIISISTDSLQSLLLTVDAVEDALAKMAAEAESLMEGSHGQT